MLKKITLFILLGVFASSSVYGQSKRKRKKADEATLSWRYETVCEKGGGSGGNYLIRVTSYVRDPSIAVEQSKKNAVHAVIFTGIPGSVSGCNPKPALTRNPSIYDEKKDFFKSFFINQGTYGKFTNLPTGRPDRVIKISKKEYKVETIVLVNVPLLRKNLEDANIIRSLW